METTTFTALCERAGRWWTIRVPQVEGLTRQVRSLDQAEIMTRQSIAQSLGIPPESIRVEVLPDAPVQVAQALQARQAAMLAVETAAHATRSALEALAREGYALEDAVTMLGLSAAEVGHYTSRPDGGPGPQGAAGPMQMAGP
jgi:methanogenic corrinoid protein MtbC1